MQPLKEGYNVICDPHGLIEQVQYAQTGLAVIHRHLMEHTDCKDVHIVPIGIEDWKRGQDFEGAFQWD